MITYPAIQLIVNDLAALRGTRTIFQRLNLTAEGGKALTVIGPNGAGKTTLLRCLAGFLPPMSGTIRLQGGDDELSVGEQCHYIGHLNGIKPALSVSENLNFFADFLAGSREHVEQAAERLALSDLEDVPAGYLSAGQKRRLGLSRLICARRPIWLLDEPSVSLDVASRDILAGIVAEHLEAGGIVVAVTHTPLGWSDAHTLDFTKVAAEREADLS